MFEKPHILVLSYFLCIMTSSFQIVYSVVKYWFAQVELLLQKIIWKIFFLIFLSYVAYPKT